MDLNRILFIPDLHAPYHHKDALKLVFHVMKDFEPHTLVILGDLLDCYKISSFSKSPDREFSFKEEVDEGNKILDQFDAFDSAGFLDRKIFIEGNHEDRLRRYLSDKAPELFEFVNTQKLLRLEERGYEFVPYKQSLQVGKLWLTHDCGTAGRYSVFRAADTFQHPIVMAHTHRLVYIVEGNATGEHFPAAQFGWLGDIEQVDYVHRVRAMREWSLGFGLGFMNEKNGHIHLQPVPLVRDGKQLTAVIGGKEYRV